ncbi:MAG: 4-hydroxy-tetrahydrodipicolinate synthase [Lachnospiraceae bacterium]|nr:4-hydroxy-tetrahydrodipicolinate synthase [Lachnospiraceae bacterium]
MSVFRGAGVAIATPMHQDLSVNYEEFARLIDFQIENGTDAIIVCGTTGESATMTEAEHVDVIRFCVEHVKHRVPVIAGAGSNATDTAVYLSKEAQDIGADAVLSVTPYYNKATQGGLAAHFTAIAAAVNIPVILYNVPGRTGCNIQPETAVALCRDVKNIVGIKDATGNLAQTTKMMSLAREAGVDLELYSGEDGLIVPILSLGGLGVISVLSNVAPKQTHDLCAQFFSGDVQGARDMQLEVLPLVDALFSEVNPIPVKRALSLIGFDCDTLRLPLTPIEKAHEEQLIRAMKNYGLIK